METQQPSRQQRRQAARVAAKQAGRQEPAPVEVPPPDNGEAPAMPPPVTMPYPIAPKHSPAMSPTTFDVTLAYDGQGRPWKVLVVSTGQGVQWYFLDQQTADQLADWLKGTAPTAASKLIIPGVSVSPDMFKGRG